MTNAAIIHHLMARNRAHKNPGKAGKVYRGKRGEDSKRGIPVQVYFSRHGHRDLIELAALRHETVSALIRVLVRKAAARARKNAPKKTSPEDPRQLRLA